MRAIVLCLIALCVKSTNAFVGPAAVRSSARHVSVNRDSRTHLTAAGENLRPDYVAESPEETRSRIEKMVTDNEVMLFMKGNKLFPQCGFSNTAVQVLRACDVKFETFDVLADPEVRQGIKDYASWPTIPQLYLKAQLVGGSDIMIDLFQSGELKKMFDEAGVAVTTE